MTAFLMDLLAVTTLISSLFVITSRNPVVAVLYLIAVFVQAACYLLLIGIGFIGLSFILVYVGAVAVLFLFVIMMLNVRVSEIVSVGREYTKNLPLGFLVGLLFVAELLSVLPSSSVNLSLYMFMIFNTWFLQGPEMVLNSYSYVHHAMPFQDIDSLYVVQSQVQALAVSLYTYGSFWILITSIILLLSIIGAVSLTLSRNPRLS